jgi:hypothetical protein
LELLDFIQVYIGRFEEHVLERIELSETIRLAKTLSVVGKILSIVIEREVGSIDRFTLKLSFRQLCRHHSQD